MDTLNYMEPSSTPIQCAIMSESLEMVKALIEKGSSLDLGNNQNKKQKNKKKNEKNEKIISFNELNDLEDSSDENDDDEDGFDDDFVPPLFTSIYYFNDQIVSFLIDVCHERGMDYLIESVSHILVAIGKKEILVSFF